MPNRFARGHRDSNEPQITEYLRRANVMYCLLPEGAGADILLYISPMAFVEVKNPSVSKDKQELTDTEKEVQRHCAETGIPYHVIKSPEEMANIINQYIERRN
jgi:hypothetical protein